MRIAIFTNNYLPNPYGVATSVETFRREFEKMGHEVYIFAPDFPGYVDKNKNIFRYPSIDIEVKFRFPLPFSRSWKMGRILKKLDIDIIHAQHPNLLGAAAARWAKKFTRRRGGKRVPLVFTWHTLYDHYAHFAKFLPEKKAGEFLISQAARYANRADAVVVPTDSIIPRLRKWGVTNEKIFPVATGVVTADFENADKNMVRDKYGIADDEVILLSTHRLTQEKNMDFLFRSLAPILQNEKVKFLVVGDGDLAPHLKQFCEEQEISHKVIFAGVVPRAEIKNYYAAADIFVHSSLSETQGMVLTEAMHMGLPVVALSATGANSLVLNNASGFLTDENSFYQELLKLIKNRELRQKFGEVSKKIVATQFTAEVCARKMVAVYESLI